jgi:hypothetical protein
MNTLRSSVRLLAATVAAALLMLPFSTARAVDSMNRYGGPIYSGSPVGDVTAELLAVGGTPGNFSTVRTLDALVGTDTVTAEVAKLKTQYGVPDVDRFTKVFDYAVNDAWTRAGKDNITFPAPATLSNHDLAVALVQAGTADDGTFWTGLMLDKAVSHKVHMQVMSDIDATYGEPADASYHKISNQLFYDVAVAMGVSAVKLASFH